MTVLSVKNLVKSMGNRVIIKDISFDVEGGEVFGFLGPNGAGKTTTIKMILGLLSIDSGEIFVNNHPVKKEFEAALDGIAGIVENPDMYGYMSGLDNLKLYANARGGVSKERIDEVVEQVGLSLRIKEKVKKYSLGMKQRLAIALCMISKPKILILDEPTNGLDPAGIKELRELLKHLAHNEGMTVFVSSHLLSEMQLMCDRVCIIDNGALLGTMDVQSLGQAGDSDSYRFKLRPLDKASELINAEMPDRIVKYFEDGVELKVSTDEEAAQITSWLSSQGVLVLGMERTEITLEDMFMNITGGGKQIG